MSNKVYKLLSKDNLEIDTTSIMAVEIENFTFEVDERFPWVKVYKRTDDTWENREYITEINEDDTPIFIDSEEGYKQLIEYCTNWLLNNPRLVKDIVAEEDK